MNKQTILNNLCIYDDRSPYYDSGWGPPQPRTDCSCTNCFYGRDALAIELLAKQEEQTMLTKKHFKAIAEIVSESQDLVCADDLAHLSTGLWRIKPHDFCNKLADYFAADNPQFDRERFLSACGL